MSLKSATACLLLGLVQITGQSLDVKQLMPRGVTPGQPIVLSFKGSKVETSTHLWTSFPARTERLTTEGNNQVQFAVTAYGQNSFGLGAVQLAGPQGLSNWQMVLIDDLVTQHSQKPNQKRTTALPLSFPCAVDADLKEESADYYKLTAKEGENVSIEIVANRVGSGMDPVLAILDGEGKELAFKDDSGSGRDPRIEFTAAYAGDYFLEVHDVGYGGGENFSYRLRLGHSPGFRFINPPPSLLPQSAKSPVLTLPGKFFATFDQPNEKDRYKFSVKDGDRVVFKTSSRSWGSGCDAHLRILSADGEQVAEADPLGAAEIALTNLFKTGGEFTLEVRELAGLSGPHLHYAIEAYYFQPGFTLFAEKPILQGKPGDTVKVKITCTRFEYDGAIELKLIDAGEGLRLSTFTIEPKKNETQLALILSDEWEPGQSIRFRIRGTGQQGAESQVSTMAALRKEWPMLLYPPQFLEGLFALGVVE